VTNARDDKIGSKSRNGRFAQRRWYRQQPSLIQMLNEFTRELG
jgi:hypothetical protein